jgi:hypothetical protein
MPLESTLYFISQPHASLTNYTARDELVTCRPASTAGMRRRYPAREANCYLNRPGFFGGSEVS